MKAVLLSVKPKWCKLIFSGEKTIEVRKTAPKLETPFKVYVYCTKQKLTKTTCMHSYLHKNEPKACKKYGEITTWCSIGDVHVNSNTPWSFRAYGMHGKVIGSFVCDKVYKIVPDGEYYSNGYDIDDDMLSETCLGREYLTGYGLGYTLYGWHISEPRLFDKPRELSDFSKYGYKYLGGCCVNNNCKNYVYNGYYQPPECKIDGCFLKRPPQSWCYVEGE